MRHKDNTKNTTINTTETGAGRCDIRHHKKCDEKYGKTSEGQVTERTVESATEIIKFQYISVKRQAAGNL